MALMLRFSKRARRRCRHAVALTLLAVSFAAAATSASAAQVNIVRKGAPPTFVPANTAYFTTIQAAVNAATAGDWILIEPGVYYEEVKVTSAHSGIWIRGMNRNTVILDGQNKPGNGIEINKASNVWVENLTARNFDTGCPSCGNEIWWNGGGGSNKSARTAGSAAT
jgi:pectin methylesterase-like acyl-CoA thioesterase